MPRIIASGSRQDAYRGFCNSLKANGEASVPVLLVDSEGPVNAGPWQHLNSRPNDHMDRPPGATDDQCHLMVQLMESWFLADPKTVKQYFGEDVVEKHLKAVADIEPVAKPDVLKRLRLASKRSSHGKFEKARNSFELLSCIDPASVERASKHAKRLLDFLRDNCT
jgi:hypothetical protein